MNEMLIFWLVLLILCIGIEVMTLGLTTIWFAGGALVAIFASLLHAPIFVQIILFFIVSLAMLFFTRPIAVKYFNKDRVKTNVESMVGRQAIVTGEIDNVKAVGQVTVNGQEWTARSCNDRIRIPEGSIVTVRAIHGVKLIVEPGNYPEGQVLKDRPTDGQNAANVNQQEAQSGENRNPEIGGAGKGAAPEMQKREADMDSLEKTGKEPESTEKEPEAGEQDL